MNEITTVYIHPTYYLSSLAAHVAHVDGYGRGHSLGLVVECPLSEAVRTIVASDPTAIPYWDCVDACDDTLWRSICRVGRCVDSL